MRNRHVYVLALVLFVVGLGLFAYKTLVIGLPLTMEDRTELWEVEAAIAFNARGRAAQVAFPLPRNSDRFTVVDQSFVSGGYGVTTETDEPNRIARLSIRRASGPQALYYRFTVFRGRPDNAVAPEGEPVVRPPKFTDRERTAADGVIRLADAQSSDRATFVAQVLRRLSAPEATEPAHALVGRNPTTLKRVQVAARIVNHARLPARVVHGVVLGLDRRHAQFSHWLEVHDGTGWRSFVADARGPGLPDNHLAWWRGPAAFATVTGGDPAHVTLTVKQVRNLTLGLIRSLSAEADNPLLTWSLMGLPLQTQLVFRVLFVVPLGVFLLVLLRNVVGVKTFGTFMPVLIALAFRETGLGWGVVLFTVVVATGLLARLYLEHLKLLLVPRLGAVLIVVIMAMALLSVLSHKLGVVRGLSVALFPMVILTMTIERMSVVWDERGPAEAMKEGTGSLAVAVLCFLAMSAPIVEHLFFVFPEALLVLLAATVLLGRYSGYRLTELARFRVLGSKEG